METKKLELPEYIIQFYLDTGIEELYPPQEEAVEKGLLDNKNLLAAIPTASGKTLISELAMLNSISTGGKCLYIVPLRALASEKFERFKEFSSIGVKVGISTGDFDSTDEWLGSNDIIVATSEKADSLLRNETSWMKDITTIVVDEIHLLDSVDRGPTLEITIAKLLRLNPNSKIIGLSATIGNAGEIAGWLDAELVQSQWRPIELYEGVFLDDNINFKQSQKPIKNIVKDTAVNLVIDTIDENGQCLVFESSRRNCAGFAKKAKSKVGKSLDKGLLDELNNIAEEVLETSDTETTKELASCIKRGTAFHHAGLNSAQRKIVEDNFRNNKIKVISSTPTLAAGLNLPARRVIVRNYKRYDPNFGMQPIPVLDYKQMSGRAGRPSLDPYGESVLISHTYNEFTDLLDRYIDAEPEDILSKLGTENALRTHVLSTIVNGFATTRQGMVDFMGSSFFAYQQQKWSLIDVVDDCIEFLQDNEMIKDDGEHLYATRLGQVISTLYIDPLSGAIIIDKLKKADKVNDMTMLHIICSTPDMRQLYLRSKEYEKINEYVMTHSDEFVEVPNPFKSIEYEWFLGEVKTALLINEWIDEKTLDDITAEFGVGEGDINALSDISEWLMHSAVNLAKLTDLDADKAQELEKRIHHGVNKDLIQLVSISNIGRVRARKLYEAGIQSVSDIKNTDLYTLSNYLGKKTAYKVLEQLGVEPEDNQQIDEEPESIKSYSGNYQGQKTFNDF
ncbi:ATP-dependent DNA helicase [Methanohalobium sp.]|uniref:ATP-dependent DNA helicase n=1 Tax=Methanohalobium sp. TaxID=2837493 RepID=UPI0025FC3FD7|nr:ATP-dependent DNA helicase [Methanohalobium sp.]